MLKQITKDIMIAMKEKDNLRKSTLQIVKGNMQNLSIEKQRDLTEAEEVQIVQREVKQTKEALKDAEKYDRSDLVQMNEAKLAILTSYLPAQMNESQVKDKLVDLGISNKMNMGQAMGLAMKNLAGKAENALISKVTKEIISNK